MAVRLREPWSGADLAVPAEVSRSRAGLVQATPGPDARRAEATNYQTAELSCHYGGESVQWGGCIVTTPDDRLATDHLEPDEREPEASPEDVAEQVQPADPATEEADVHLGDEASEWDAIEQARVVELDDEDHER